MHVVNIPHRLLDGKVEALPPVTAPRALQLVQEPQVNVLRYDALRELERRPPRQCPPRASSTRVSPSPTTSQVWKAMDCSLGTYVRAQIEEAGVLTMSKARDNGFRNVTTSSKPVREPGYLKGVELRVPPAPMLLDLFKADGSSLAPINFNELYSALRTHLVACGSGALPHHREPRNHLEEDAMVRFDATGRVPEGARERPETRSCAPDANRMSHPSKHCTGLPSAGVLTLCYAEPENGRSEEGRGTPCAMRELKRDADGLNALHVYIYHAPFMARERSS